MADELCRIIAETGNVLQYFTYTENFEGIKELADLGVNLNVIGGLVPPPLYVAVASGNIEMSKLLLDAGANVNFPWFGNKPMTDVEMLFLDPGNDEMKKLLINAKAFPHIPANSEEEMPDLEHSLFWCHLPEMEKYIAKGANVNACDEFGATPLHQHTFDGRGYEVRELIEHGADVNAQDAYGVTPLMIAAYGTSFDVINLLEKKDEQAFWEEINRDEYSCWESPQITCSIAELLIEHGADINITDRFGRKASDFVRHNFMKELFAKIEKKKRRAQKKK